MVSLGSLSVSCRGFLVGILEGFLRLCLGSLRFRLGYKAKIIQQKTWGFI
jgi:hypothetical protein